MAIFICLVANARHSPVHDCESTLWLTVWVIAFITKDRTRNEVLRAEVLEVISLLRPTDWTLEASGRGKKFLLWQFLDGEVPILFRPFLPILKDMAKLVKEYNNLSLGKHEAGETYTKQAIRACIVTREIHRRDR
jgi:hypothetical protein